MASPHGNIGRRSAVGALAATTVGAVVAVAGQPPPAGAGTPTDPLVFDPRDHGARFDGSSDDTEAIKAANVAAAEASGTLLIPPGVGIVSSTIPLLDGVTYRGHARETSVLKAAPGTAIGAVMAADNHLGNRPWSGGPTSVSGFTIDGNRGSGSTGSGIVLMNYRSVVSDLRVQSVSANGIVIADRTASGTVLENTAVENRISACWVHDAGGCGILVTDTARSGAATDGYIEGCVVSKAGVWAIRVERAAGWFIAHNHTYGNLQNGIYLDQLWCTSVHHNEVDHFGTDGGAKTYTGFHVQNVIAGRPSTISHNHAAADEASASTVRYFLFRAPSVDVTLNLWANTAHVDSGRAASSTAFLLMASPGGRLTVRGGPSNVADGPAVACSTLGDVGYADGQPGQAWSTPAAGAPASADGAGAPLIDPLGLGVATTVDPATLSGTAPVGDPTTAISTLLLGSGQTTSSLVLHVGAAEGTIEVGIYGSAGAGRNRTPSTRKATTGRIPCPPPGVQVVDLTTPVVIAPGDFAAIWVERAAATFGRATALGGDTTMGRAFVHPSLPDGLPTTMPASTTGPTAIPWVSTP